MTGLPTHSVQELNVGTVQLKEEITITGLSVLYACVTAYIIKV